MLVISGEHDEDRSRVCIFLVEQARTISEWYIYKERVLQYVRGTLIKELLIVTLELQCEKKKDFKKRVQRT
jgi:hypothetical protein